MIRIVRFECSDRGTAGALLVNDEFVCMTLERPWRDNMRNVSCIPPGTYNIEAYHSNRHGYTYKVIEVPNRSGILFHKGNEITETQGCILLGQEIKARANRLSILKSTKAFALFVEKLQGVQYTVIEIESVL